MFRKCGLGFAVVFFLGALVACERKPEPDAEQPPPATNREGSVAQESGPAGVESATSASPPTATTGSSPEAAIAEERERQAALMLGMARSAEKDGKLEQAVESYEAAVEAQPGLEEAKAGSERVAALLDERKRISAALAEFDRRWSEARSAEETQQWRTAAESYGKAHEAFDNGKLTAELTGNRDPAAKAAEMRSHLEPMIARLIGRLGDSSVKAREEAAKALGGMGVVAVPQLVEALEDENRAVRICAMGSLKKIGPEAGAAVPALIRATGDQNDDVRGNAVRTLGPIGPAARTAVPALIERMGSKEKNWRIREEAMRALAEIGPDAREAVPNLIAALGDDSQSGPTWAAFALAGIGADAVPALIRALDSDDACAVHCAAWTLGRIGADAEKAVPRLEKLARTGGGDLAREGHIFFRIDRFTPTGIEMTTVKPNVREASKEALARIRAAIDAAKAKVVPSPAASLPVSSAPAMDRAAGAATGRSGRAPDWESRYKWKSKWQLPFGAEGITVRGGKGGNSVTHTLKGKGAIPVIGRDIVIDLPGSRDVRIEIDPEVRQTTYAGLTFTRPCVVDIQKDGTLVADREGVVATDSDGSDWKSQRSTPPAGEVVAFFPAPGRQPSLTGVATPKEPLPAESPGGGVPAAGNWEGTSEGKIWMRVVFTVESDRRSVSGITRYLGHEGEEKPFMRWPPEGAKASIADDGTFAYRDRYGNCIEGRFVSSRSASGTTSKSPFKVKCPDGVSRSHPTAWTAVPKSPSKSRRSQPLASDRGPLPRFTRELKGSNEVRVRNPNDFGVKVGVRSGGGGKDFTVGANGVASVFVPDGKYDIYFVYSNKPDALFQGDGFTLKRNGVDIRIVKVVGGNYGIRRVK